MTAVYNVGPSNSHAQSEVWILMGHTYAHSAVLRSGRGLVERPIYTFTTLGVSIHRGP